MNLMDWNGKKVFVMLKNRRVYSGIVQNVSDSSEFKAYLTLNDIYNKTISIKYSEITLIQEEELNQIAN
jgi:small nuclear ribonucleoprotein (snRNP)-like protein